ncbi:MAG: hypothetical protein V4792_04315 [Pseudomonadota bacterium]
MTTPMHSNVALVAILAESDKRWMWGFLSPAPPPPINRCRLRVVQRAPAAGNITRYAETACQRAGALQRYRRMALVDIIDFKWLMAHEGWRVHVERLQRDMGYARECLELADTSTSPDLHKAADALRREICGVR